MGKIFAFWMGDVPYPQFMMYDDWQSFRSEIGWWLVGAVIVGVSITIVCYRWLVQEWTIRRPDDLFRPYMPMRKSLWLALVPALALGIVHWSLYASLFPEAPAHVGGAIVTALVGGAITLLLSYAVMLTAPVTPSKYRYRPLWFCYRKKHARP